MEQATKKKGLPTWAVVLIVLAVAGPVVLGVFSALAIYGVRKYMQAAKAAEATAALQAFGTGMVACGEKDGTLPPTTAPVPASVPAAMKYQSAPGDWAEPGFSCAGFAPSTPQYFQYQWVQASSSQGVLRALADLNGDGTVEETYEVTVSCNSSRCTASAPAKAAP